MIQVTCEQCGKSCLMRAGHVNRSRKAGMRLFCDRACAGLARRNTVVIPIEERKAAKRQYDAERRVRLADEIKAKKRAYYLANRDPDKERAIRQKNMARHVEYCRRYYQDPKRKQEKVAYDQQRRDAKYAEYAECHRLLIELQNLVRTLEPSRYERAKARGYYNNGRQVIERKRDANISRW